MKSKVRALVGDPSGDFCTDAYLNPLVNIVYQDQTTTLMSETGSSFDEAVFDVPDLPIGTTNLGNWQAATMVSIDPNSGAQTNSTGPLNGLVTPICVEWKQVGQPDAYYVEANRTGKLPNISPGAPSVMYAMEWEWRGMVIYLTPVSFPVDVRVRGEFGPKALTQDTDVLTISPRMVEAVAYGTAALVGQERNNATYTEGYANQAQRVLDNIANMLVRAEQGTTTRVGRTYSSNGWGAGWNRQ